jgi:hypothetical protein
MSHIRAGARPAFALFVMAHALAHVLMPWQEFFLPANLASDAGPPILIGVAVLGFMIAGVGLLGVRPFTFMIRPAMVLASAYSLIAIWRMGSGEFWWGAPVGFALFLTGLTGLYRFLPAPSTASHPEDVRVSTERRFV